MNFKNIAENLGIAIVMLVLGGFIGFFASKKSYESAYAQMTPTIEKAIAKATNEITNEIKVDKIKKSEPVRIVMSPDNKQMIVRDTCIGFAWEKLTDGQKRRLERWLED